MLAFSLVFALASALSSAAANLPADLQARRAEATAPQLTRRSQCAATLTAAESIANRLQSRYFNIITGEYSELWTDANSLEDLHNLMLAAGTTTWSSLADESYIGRIANIGLIPWTTVLSGSYDDAQWVMLALWKMADYKAAHGSSTTNFMNSAAEIYNIVASQWDDTCGGGVWWSSAKNYKNAITNQLFLLTSAEGYIRTKNETYLQNAQKTWDWLSASGMRNSQGLYNDGLDTASCKNNGQTTWTYNQGVIASGLAALYSASGSSNSTLLDQAEITLDATMAQMTENGILKESCDDVVKGGTTCDADQQIFKGIWTKHLQYYLDNANDAARTAKYSPILGAQESAVVHYGTDSSKDVVSTWYAASQGGGSNSAQSQASGLEAYIASAKYGPC